MRVCANERECVCVRACVHESEAAREAGLASTRNRLCVIQRARSVHMGANKRSSLPAQELVNSNSNTRYYCRCSASGSELLVADKERL